MKRVLSLLIVVSIVVSCCQGAININTELVFASEGLPELAVPQNLTAEDIQANSVQLSWDNSTDVIENISYLIIQDDVEVKSVTETTCVVEGLSEMTTYTFFVMAVDSEGNKSDCSDTIEITTIRANASDDFVVQNIHTESSADSISLTWGSLEGINSYEINANEKIYTVTTSCSYIISDLPENHSETIKIRGVGSNDNMAWCEEIIAWTKYASVENVQVLENADKYVEITWDDKGEDAIYNVKRGTEKGIYEEVGINITDTTFIDDTAEGGITYYYVVTAINNGGESEISEVKEIQLELIPMMQLEMVMAMEPLGTESNPYLITTREELEAISNDLTAYYKLGNDIDLQNNSWIPIGTVSTPFTGNINGNGYSIINISIDEGTYGYVGLFGVIDGGQVNNININNFQLESTVINQDGNRTNTNSSVGGLAGYVKGDSLINNCHVTSGEVVGYSYVGGLIGRNEGGVIENCSTAVEVIGQSSCGGLIGYSESNVSACYAEGNVTGYSYSIGGLIGQVKPKSTYNNSYVEECYAVGDIQGDSSEAGGLIGKIDSSNGKAYVTNCFATGDVLNTRRYVGGLVGYAGSKYDIQITNSYSAGEVKNADNSSSNLFAYSGGLLGYTSGEVVTISNSYYDGVAAQHIPTVKSPQGKLTSGMKAQETFENWDFDEKWEINEGNSYPYLKGIKKPVQVSESLPENDVAGGIGTENNPFLIETKEQFNNIRYDVSSHYKLMDDINLDTDTWIPIGGYEGKTTSTNQLGFFGVLDGNGYTISNFKLSENAVCYNGLFSTITDGTIKNLTLEEAYVNNTEFNENGSYSNPITNVGALAGYISGDSTIENCHIKSGKVIGYSNVGGLVGKIENGYIIYCSSNADVTAKYKGGGLVGYSCSSIKDSYATGNVKTFDGEAGGLVGYLYPTTNSINMEGCYATGDIQGGSSVGGLIGYSYSYNKSISIKDCYALGDIEISSRYGGGLIGKSAKRYNYTVKNCYSAGKVSTSGTSSTIRGLIDQGRITVTNCYFDSSITGFTTPEEQARTTEQMNQINNYYRWDFSSTWMFKEGENYPLLQRIENYLEPPYNFRAVNVEPYEIELAWDLDENDGTYELEINGDTFIDVGTNNNYIHSNLTPGLVYQYRIRKNNDIRDGQWSSKIEVITPLETPENLSVQVLSDGSLSFSWDNVIGAQSYEIQINGEEISVDNTNYILTHLDINTQYMYRVRAVSDVINSNWTTNKTYINWDENNPAICLALENPQTDIDSEVPCNIVLKGNNITDLYTIHLELSYDPSKLAIIEEQFKELVFINESNKYQMTSFNKNEGIIKIMLSLTGDRDGVSNSADILKLNGDMLTVQDTYLTIDSIKLVNSDGRYIDVPETLSTKIYMLESN